MLSSLDALRLFQTTVIEINAAPDLNAAFNAIVRTICRHCSWSCAEIWQQTAQTSQIEYVSRFYSSTANSIRNTVDIGPHEQVSETCSFSSVCDIVERIWTSQQWEWHTDRANLDANICQQQEASECDVQTIFGVPIVVNERTVALLLFFSPQIIEQDNELIVTIEKLSSSIEQRLKQMRIEEQLVNSEARFHTFMTHSPAVIFVKDEAGRYTYANPQLQKCTNLDSPSSLLGKTDFDLFSPEIAAQFCDNDTQVLASRQAQSFVEVFPSDDGFGVHSQLVKFPFLDQRGQQVIGGIAIDITEQKRLEHQLQTENEKQQQMNQSLQQALIAAQEAAQAKSRFLSMMSHEIRTPMNAVIGMAEVLADTPLDNQQQELLKSIQLGSDMLLRVINDILDFSKLEANKVELEAGCLDLKDCLEQTATMFAHQAKEKGIRLRTQLLADEHPTCFVGDAVRLRQVLSNLVSNSLKFTPSGEVVVQMQVKPAKADNNAQIEETCEILCSVSDTGIGIPAERLHRLFQPFSQVDASTTRQYGGTGLGLAIIKQIVERMDGQVSVTSEVGKGSTFSFSIRLALHHSQADGVIRESRKDSEAIATRQVSATAVAMPSDKCNQVETHKQTHLPRVLLIEDLRLHQKILLKMLAKSGYSADVVSDGKAALDTLQQTAYDLVLMDVEMAELDALVATRLVRARSHTKQPYIIATMTSSATNGCKAYLDSGMNDYLTKPIEQQTWAAALQRFDTYKQACPILAL